MINERQKRAVIHAYLLSKDMERPILRLCADIRLGVSDDFYRAAENEALRVYDDAVFLIGGYADLLEPSATRYLQEKDFPYSVMDVDGINKNGDVNVGIWMVRNDVLKAKPSGFARTFSCINDIVLGERVESLDDLPEDMRELEAIKSISKLAESCGLGKLPLLKIAYVYDGNPYPMSLPGPYMRLPPKTWGFYGEKEAPAELLEFERQLRKFLKR